ncbi:MAG: hypothetical protein V1753_07160, partial [Pseudomonadota bacterium]
MIIRSCIGRFICGAGFFFLALLSGNSMFSYAGDNSQSSIFWNLVGQDVEIVETIPTADKVSPGDTLDITVTCENRGQTQQTLKV